MATPIFIVATATGTALVGLLLLTLVVPTLRIWPTPGTGSWQGYVFLASVPSFEPALFRGCLD